jgi:SAM-dependent methyltransferase
MNQIEENIDFLLNQKMLFGIPAISISDTHKTLSIPNTLDDHIPTLNRMGYMKIDLDEFCREFIEYATSKEGLVLELGCAYGFIVQQVLAKGGKIIASDLSDEHLFIVRKNTPQEYLNNLYLYPGSFPDNIHLPLESLSAVLTSRMMHFLQGEEVEKGLDKIHSWLMPNGKLYFVATSPYNIAFKSFLPTYLDRIEKGVKWPGVVSNLQEVALEHKEFLGSYINLFDVPQLQELLPKHGFKIEKINLFDYALSDSEGKGHIGFVATKI